MDDLYRRRPARGTAEVICYHPDHSKTFALLSDTQAADVVALWKGRSVELAKDPEINHILIFENQGSLVGTSNPHPHGRRRLLVLDAAAGRPFVSGLVGLEQSLDPADRRRQVVNTEILLRTHP